MNLHNQQMFRSAFERLFPEYLRGFSAGVRTTPNSIVLFRSVSSQSPIVYYIHVLGSSSRDEFTIDVAWNTSDTFPVGGRPTKIAGNAGSFSSESLTIAPMRQRIGRFLGMKVDYWWTLGPKATAQNLLSNFKEFARGIEAGTLRSVESTAVSDKEAEKIVEDALSKIAMVVLPFFSAVAEAHHDSRVFAS
jgi:hypothetical protein